MARNFLSERGQMLPSAAFLLMLTALLMFMVFNHGHITNQKVQLVNAADAAAYSGAVWTARNLNFMAYTNRAIYANHVAMGHFVGYMSWMRIYAKIANDSAKILKYIPEVGVYIAQINRLIQEGKALVEKSLAPTYINSVSEFNQTVFATQQASRVVGIKTLEDIITKTAQAHNPAIRVNDSKDIQGVVKEAAQMALLQPVTKIADSQIAHLGKVVQMYINYYQFTESYTLIRDVKDGNVMRHIAMTNKMIYGMEAGGRIESNGMPQQKWYYDRGWNFSPFGIRLLKKTGSTTFVESGPDRDWSAIDQAFIRHCSLLHGCGWKEFESAKATASEFALAKKYRGLPGYQELGYSERKKRNSPSNKSSLRYAVLVALPEKQLTMPLTDAKQDQGSLYAISQSEVFYARPLSLLSSKKGFTALGSKEYPNLFNPFWQAKLI